VPHPVGAPIDRAARVATTELVTTPRRRRTGLSSDDRPSAHVPIGARSASGSSGSCVINNSRA